MCHRNLSPQWLQSHNQYHGGILCYVVHFSRSPVSPLKLPPLPLRAPPSNTRARTFLPRIPSSTLAPHHSPVHFFALSRSSSSSLKYIATPFVTFFDSLNLHVRSTTCEPRQAPRRTDLTILPILPSGLVDGMLVETRK